MSALSLRGAFAVPLVLLASLAQAEAPPNPIFEKVGIVEKLNEPIPTALSFVDSEGKQVRLAEWIKGDKPVVLSLVYYQCPVLCNLVLSGLSRSLKSSGLELGTDYRAITVSIDPEEKSDLAAEKKRGYLQSMGLNTQSSDWGFLTGNQPEISTLASAAGFQYAYDEQIKQFAHNAAIFILTPDGKLSRYLYGVDYSPRDLRFALVEASGGRVGTSLDKVLLTCYKYDPAKRKYAFFISTFMKTGGLLVFAALGTALTIFWRREFKRGTVK